MRPDAFCRACPDRAIRRWSSAPGQTLSRSSRYDRHRRAGRVNADRTGQAWRKDLCPPSRTRRSTTDLQLPAVTLTDAENTEADALLRTVADVPVNATWGAAPHRARRAGTAVAHPYRSDRNAALRQPARPRRHRPRHRRHPRRTSCPQPPRAGPQHALAQGALGGCGLVGLELHHRLGPYGKAGDGRGAGQASDSARQPAATYQGEGLRMQQSGKLMAQRGRQRQAPRRPAGHRWCGAGPARGPGRPGRCRCRHRCRQGWRRPGCGAVST